jgi:hypothetical protein
MSELRSASAIFPIVITGINAADQIAQGMHLFKTVLPKDYLHWEIMHRAPCRT